MFRPLSTDHACALAMAYELHRLLGELYDTPAGGPTSAIEDARNRMDDVKVTALRGKVATGKL